MDNRRLIEFLRATIDPNQRQQAEDQLIQIQKIIGFAPSLLQVIMSADVDMPVRQAGAIYLKNLINHFWIEKEVEPGKPLHFTVHEQDRAMIRDSIVDAVVLAPPLISIQLCICVNTIIKYDFPGRWTQIVDKISIYLQNPDAEGWSGALLCLYQLIKNYEYKKAQERGPLNESMNLLLPLIYQLCVRLLPDESKQSVLLQKQILKIYFGLTQYVLPLELITKEVFSQWMEIVRQVLDRPVPEETNQVEDDEERAMLPWWKCKKWAIHILHRMFERYGSPGNVEKSYKEFASWYLKTFTAGILEVMLKILDQQRNKIFVAPRVIQQTLGYIHISVSHAFSWKLLKVHMFTIIRDVIFPLMSHSKDDEELWNTDPREYIRIKYDIFEDFVSPVNSAGTLLHAACKKRRDMLDKSMQFIMQVLTSPDADSRQKDGALHMVGTLAVLLFKKEPYKSQMEQMLVQYVYPLFSYPEGFLRARACWVIHYFNELKFKASDHLVTGVRLVVHALLNDQELPVRVEAAVALQVMLNHQEIVEKLIQPQIKQITMELLKIIRETENDELNNVMQKIVSTYVEELTPTAVEICQHLATTFSMVVESDEGSDEKAITAMGLLNTIETLLSVMEQQLEVMAMLEPIVLQVAGHIFTNSVNDFYEEALSLVYILTSKKISPDMWKMFELLYQVFEKDGFDYFTDMMPALHNYVTVDTDNFLSNEHRVLAIFNMCKTILTGDAGEDAECNAAKLLEVIILQCKGRIDQCIPSFVELVLQRLMLTVKTSELRTMCLQVVIAALYYNPPLLFETMNKIQACVPTGESISTHFIKQWIQDTDCFLGLHDRKLCVLGLCALLTMGPQKPPAVNECASQFIPCFLLLFDGLKKAYAAKAQEGLEEEEDEEEESELEDVLSSDEDEIDSAGNQYLENLEKRLNKKNTSLGNAFQINSSIQDEEDEDEDDDDDDDLYEPDDETPLECYKTPLDEDTCDIDEYVVFQQVFGGLQGSDPLLYTVLTSALTPLQQEGLKEVLVYADQRKAAAESKRIEQSGGYNFVNQTVPKTFKFGENRQ